MRLLTFRSASSHGSLSIIGPFCSSFLHSFPSLLFCVHFSDLFVSLHLMFPRRMVLRMSGLWDRVVLLAGFSFKSLSTCRLSLAIIAILSVPNQVFHSVGGFAPESQNGGTPRGVLTDDCAMWSRAICRLCSAPKGEYSVSDTLVSVGRYDLSNITVDCRCWSLRICVYVCFSVEGQLMILKRIKFKNLFLATNRLYLFGLIFVCT